MLCLYEYNLQHLDEPEDVFEGCLKSEGDTIRSGCRNLFMYVFKVFRVEDHKNVGKRSACVKKRGTVRVYAGKNVGKSESKVPMTRGSCWSKK